MNDYIDRAALGIGLCNRDVFENKGYADGWNAAVKVFKEAPAVDVQEIKHGEWIKYRPGNALDGAYFCSTCFKEQKMADGMITPLDRGYHYCPNCGAKMIVRTAALRRKNGRRHK